MGLLRAAWCVLRLLLLPRSQLALENLALRQQLAVLSRQPRLHLSTIGFDRYLFPLPS